MADLSCIAKLARAKEHLIDLDEAVQRFVNSHPYTVSQRVEGKKQRRRWRVEFTASPADTDIPVIAADAVNNLRFALDHLMCALVPPKERGKVTFPIFFQGVWDAIVPGENQQRIKERMRWASDVKSLPDDAVTILKRCQAPLPAPDGPQITMLRQISGWSNRDRHERLPILTTGIKDIKVTVTREDGGIETADINPKGGGDSFPDGAELPIPDYAVDVQITGVALVAIRGRDDKSYSSIPSRLVLIAETIEKGVFPALAPFVRSDAT
jgi:hypothetical protein